MRLSSEDLRKLVSVLKRLDTQFTKVEKLFNNLSTAAKKAKLRGSIPAAGGDACASANEETPDAQLTVPFHTEARQYLSAYAELSTLCLPKINAMKEQRKGMGAGAFQKLSFRPF